jgi:methylated-DNA-[protein]-cysteine S-methyltransferase
VTVTAGGATSAAHAVLATRLGELTLVREEGGLAGLYFPRHWPRPDRTRFGPRTDDGFDEVARQLGEYLSGERGAFELPLKVRGSEFDRRVWELISAIPYGQTTTYGELARELGAGTDPRDVGAAVGRNPLCVVIPCHRVIGATGKLTGYAGGLGRKRALLEIEHAGALRAGNALAGLGSLPRLVAAGAADGAGTVAGGDGGRLVGEEDTVPHVSAARDRAQR